MFPKWIEELFIVFNLWGFSTQFEKSPKLRKLNLIILVLHIIVASITTSSILLYLFRPINDKLGTINDVFKLSALSSVYWLSLVEFYIQRKKQLTFWKYVRYIDHNFCSQQNIKLSSYRLKMKIYFITTTFVYFWYFIRMLSTTGYIFFWISYTLMCTVFQLLHILLHHSITYSSWIWSHMN